MIPVRFNPADYSVNEGVNTNAVITLEALEDHPDFAYNIAVLSQDGTAIREFMSSLTQALDFIRRCILFLNLSFFNQVTLTMKGKVSL